MDTLITDWEKFRAFAAQHGDKTQVEMAEQWARTDQCSNDFSCLAQDRLHAKKKSYGYRERDETKRQAFIEQLATQTAETIVYVDEAGMDNRDEYAYGWNQRCFSGRRIRPETTAWGRRFHALKSGSRLLRVNMIAALCQQRLLAPFTIEGSCNRLVFETWLSTCLHKSAQTWSSCDCR